MNIFRECLNKYWLLGSYDWKLITIMLVSSLILSSISFGMYGEDTWWCSSSRKYVSYKVILSIFIIISLTIFCYIKVKLKINSIDKTLLENSDVNHKRLAEINCKFGHKVI